MSIDSLWHHWAKLYNEVLDKHAPLKKKRVRGDQLPWITPQLQREISRRNRLFKLHARNPTKISWEAFKKQRNKVTSLKRLRIVPGLCPTIPDCAHGHAAGAKLLRVSQRFQGIIHPLEQNFNPTKCSTILNRLNIWEQDLGANN